MPSSDEMFAEGQGPLTMFGPGSQPQDGTSHLAAPMFPNIVENPDIPGLSPDELEKQKMEAVRFSKGVKIKEIHVHTFDLSDPVQVEDYKSVQRLLLTLMAQEAVHVNNWDKINVKSPEPKFLVHLDFIEYGLEKTDHATGQTTLDGVIVDKGTPDEEQ